MKGHFIMPKLKPSPQEERNRIVRACIASGQERQAITDEFLAEHLGIGISTFRKRKSHPELFTLGELQILSNYLKFTPIQAASIVLGRDITSKEVKEFIMA